MDILELITQRYSVRNYSDKPVEQEKLDNVVPVCMLDLGYPAQDSKPAPKHFTRIPLENTVKEL